MRSTLVAIAVLASISLPAGEAAAQLPHFTPLQADLVVVHKARRLLELRREGRTIRSFRIALGSNPVGPKRMEGDGRTPEGVYTLDWRNENSNFYRSLHVSYPQAWDYDRAARWGVRPGNLIMIHGLPNGAPGPAAASHPAVDWTDGCIAVTNDEMDEIWDRVPDDTPIIIYP